MIISRLFIAVINCAAATKKAHVIILSHAHRHDGYIRSHLTLTSVKRFQENRSQHPPL